MKAHYSMNLRRFLATLFAALLVVQLLPAPAGILGSGAAKADTKEGAEIGANIYVNIEYVDKEDGLVKILSSFMGALSVGATDTISLNIPEGYEIDPSGAHELCGGSLNGNELTVSDPGNASDIYVSIICKLADISIMPLEFTDPVTDNYTLVVNYVINSDPPTPSAPPGHTFTVGLENGGDFYFASPIVTGYTPDKAYVSGNMADAIDGRIAGADVDVTNSTVTITVTYYLNKAVYTTEYWFQLPNDTDNCAKNTGTYPDITGTASVGTLVTAAALGTPPAGYHLRDTLLPSAYVVATGTTTLKVYYDLNAVTVNFDANNAHDTTPATTVPSLTGLAGQTITLPPGPVRPNVTVSFDGWYFDANNNGAIDAGEQAWTASDTLPHNTNVVNLIAHWTDTAVPYRIQFWLEGVAVGDYSQLTEVSAMLASAGINPATATYAQLMADPATASIVNSFIASQSVATFTNPANKVFPYGTDPTNAPTTITSTPQPDGSYVIDFKYARRSYTISVTTINALNTNWTSGWDAVNWTGTYRYGTTIIWTVVPLNKALTLTSPDGKTWGQLQQAYQAAGGAAAFPQFPLLPEMPPENLRLWHRIIAWLAPGNTNSADYVVVPIVELHYETDEEGAYTVPPAVSQDGLPGEKYLSQVYNEAPLLASILAAFLQETPPGYVLNLVSTDKVFTQGANVNVDNVMDPGDRLYPTKAYYANVYYDRIATTVSYFENINDVTTPYNFAEAIGGGNTLQGKWGTTLNSPTPPDRADGWRFAGWYTQPYVYVAGSTPAQSTRLAADGKFPKQSHTNAYAYWVPPEPPFIYEFRENPPAGKAADDVTDMPSQNSGVIISTGQKISEPSDPALDGYEFVGWFTKDSHGNYNSVDSYNFETIVVRDTILYAKWKPVVPGKIFTVHHKYLDDTERAPDVVIGAATDGTTPDGTVHDGDSLTVFAIIDESDIRPVTSTPPEITDVEVTVTVGTDGYEYTFRYIKPLTYTVEYWTYGGDGVIGGGDDRQLSVPVGFTIIDLRQWEQKVLADGKVFVYGPDIEGYDLSQESGETQEFRTVVSDGDVLKVWYTFSPGSVDLVIKKQWQGGVPITGAITFRVRRYIGATQDMTFGTDGVLEVVLSVADATGDPAVWRKVLDTYEVYAPTGVYTYEVEEYAMPDGYVFVSAAVSP